jgi:hypothetical protein
MRVVVGLGLSGSRPSIRFSGPQFGLRVVEFGAQHPKVGLPYPYQSTYVTTILPAVGHLDYCNLRVP